MASAAELTRGAHVSHAKHGTGAVLIVPSPGFSTYWVERWDGTGLPPKKYTDNGFWATAIELKRVVSTARLVKRTRR